MKWDKLSEKERLDFKRDFGVSSLEHTKMLYGHWAFLAEQAIMYALKNDELITDEVVAREIDMLDFTGQNYQLELTTHDETSWTCNFGEEPFTRGFVIIKGFIQKYNDDGLVGPIFYFNETIDIS